ncbi:10607_t:CDS:2 [Acaulospora colombiana]|uniref:10607_t:CDS:1 n=1 Tax=Acaulospora colombiana TaxID=27376 RepID=A0ACA9MGM2_9GLOM|nr:10607_t:CDS:2 [Acaulospora colombiana]
MAPMPPLKLTLKANSDKRKGGKYSRRPPLLPSGGPKQTDTSTASPGKFWATLVPLEAGLPKIYLTESSHVLGKHCDRREDLDRFKLLPADKKIADTHCLIYKANSTVNGKTRTTVHLQNLGWGTLVRNIFVGDTTIELYGSENISFPSSREERPWYKYQFFLENTAPPPTSFFKKFAIQGELGKGKFSEVKLVRPIKHNEFGHSQEFAVKVIEKNLTCRIVHRDLKPENILVTDASRYQVKISDFGLSKLLGAKYSLMNTVCGTPTYVAPEIINRDTEYGKAVDMWSLGVILYVCLSGYPPFSEHFAPPTLLEQVRAGRYTFRSPPWDSISDEAKDLVQGLLKVDFTSRLTAEQALKHPFMNKQTPFVTRPSSTLPDSDIPLRRVHDQSASSSNEEFRQIMTAKTSTLINSIESGDETFLTASDTIASSSELSIHLNDNNSETLYTTATGSDLLRNISSQSSYASSRSLNI